LGALQDRLRLVQAGSGAGVVAGVRRGLARGDEVVGEVDQQLDGRAAALLRLVERRDRLLDAAGAREHVAELRPRGGRVAVELDGAARRLLRLREVALDRALLVALRRGRLGLAAGRAREQDPAVHVLRLDLERLLEGASRRLEV